MKNTFRHFYLFIFISLILTGCGVQPGLTSFHQNQNQSPIIDGEPSAEGDYPAVGALIVTGKIFLSGNLIAVQCTASLIDTDVILLAAHCVDPQFLVGISNVKFYFSLQRDLGSIGFSSEELPSDAVLLANKVSHPDYSLTNTTPVNGVQQLDDIALGFLAQEILTVEPGMVMGSDDSDVIEEGAAVSIVGYGVRSADFDPYNPIEGDSGVKYQADTIINEVGDYEMQIGDYPPVPQKCHGDSGGPTFFTYSDGLEPSLRIVGITSHTYDATDCARGGVDTRVNPYRNWIEAEMTLACTNGKKINCSNSGLLPEPEAPPPPPPPPKPPIDPVTPHDPNDPADTATDASVNGKGCQNTTGSPVLFWLSAAFVLINRKRK